MKWPVLIKLESKKIAFWAKSIDEFPLNVNFKIVKPVPKNELIEDIEYRVIFPIKETALQTKENTISIDNDEAQEDIRPPSSDSP